MKKIIGLLFAALLMVGGFSMQASAQTNVNQRQRNQQRRIYRGLRSGQLNGREAARLERAERNTNRMERRYRRSGGGLSYRERVRLQNRLNRNSSRIYRQKHDRQHYRRY